MIPGFLEMSDETIAVQFLIFGRKIISLVVVVCLLLPASVNVHGQKKQSISEADLGAVAFDALENFAGTVMVMDPASGRILKRIGRGMDIQFESSPFELAQIITAYAALDARLITEKTLLPCDEAGAKVTVIEALSRPCPLFFTDLGRRLTSAQFVRAAAQIGFTYHSIEKPVEDAVSVKPVPATIDNPKDEAALTALASRGEGMRARDLHFSQLALTLATGVSSAERLTTMITLRARIAAPAVSPLNRQALAVVRQGMLRAVDEGEARSAASIDSRVVARIGSGKVNDERRALCVSYAPVNDPQLALVVFLKDAAGRDAAEVTGKFYEKWFGLKR